MLLAVFAEIFHDVAGLALEVEVAREDFALLVLGFEAVSKLLNARS